MTQTEYIDKLLSLIKEDREKYNWTDKQIVDRLLGFKGQGLSLKEVVEFWA
jgi:hypothetical protein